MKIKKAVLTEIVRKVLKEGDFDAQKFPFPKADSKGDYAKYMAKAGKPELDGGEPGDDKVGSANKADSPPLP
jgi:hypothetical protein